MDLVTWCHRPHCDSVKTVLLLCAMEKLIEMPSPIEWGVGEKKKEDYLSFPEKPQEKERIVMIVMKEKRGEGKGMTQWDRKEENLGGLDGAL